MSEAGEPAVFKIPITMDRVQEFLTELSKVVDLNYCHVGWDAETQTITVTRIVRHLPIVMTQDGHFEGV